MRSLLPLITLAVALGGLSCLNPGVQIQLTKDGLVHSMGNILPLINAFVNGIQFEKDLSEDGLTLKEIKLHSEPVAGKQVNLNFHKATEEITLDLKDLQVTHSFSLEIQMWGTQAKGTGKISSFVTETNTSSTFREPDVKDPRPYLDAKVGELKFKEDSIKVELDLKDVPAFILDFLNKILKQKVLKKIYAQTSLEVQKKLQETLQKVVQQKFQTAYEIPHTNAVVSTGIIRKPSVSDTELLFPLDGVFFQKSKGYTREVDPVAFVPSQLKKSVAINVSETSVEYLLKALNGYEYDFQYSVLSCTIVMKSDNPKFTITPELYSVKDFKFDILTQIVLFDTVLSITADASFTMSPVIYSCKCVMITFKTFSITNITTKSSIPLFDKLKNIIKRKIETNVLGAPDTPIEIVLLPPELEFRSLEVKGQDHLLLTQANFKLGQKNEISLEQL